MKYTKLEILSILKANQRQVTQIEKGNLSENEINYELSIRDWMDEMELWDVKELCNYYSNIFELGEVENEFCNSLKPIYKKTIGNFCEFISQKAIKPKIESIKLFGRNCEEAGIFRHLKMKLIEVDKKAIEIKPSSKIKAYMNVFAFRIVEEVNRINPKILPQINYEPNALEKLDWKIFLSGLIILVLASLTNNWIIAGIGIGILITAIGINKFALKFAPNKFEFERIKTFRDLVEKIKEEKN